MVRRVPPPQHMEENARRAGLFSIAKAAAKDFADDKCATRAAALSYSTVFALPPLLILLIMLAGTVCSPQSVQQALESQFSGMIGNDGARMVRQMVGAADNTRHGLMATIAGLLGLMLGATGAFLALQDALNTIWEVK